ncbi:divalent-cation tolerance protein CutA [uncultured Serinicoccus sp.]|uniref:divalent-cation tolerance protein CutA n=1 Tax=uncultured Serinicoccus sp. TaxID=735514 RepID=UPI0026026F79|nr:divalent-cation tolerance protein CutA [uncultured Serinicoccus sp.]
MTDPSHLVEVRVSVPSMESARHIGEALVARRAAACVQVLGPMTSIYSWSGEVHESKEWLLLAKTSREAFGRLCETVRSLHPYEVPEIMAVPVVDALDRYAAWVTHHLGGSGAEQPRGPGY